MREKGAKKEKGSVKQHTGKLKKGREKIKKIEKRC